MTAPSPEPSHQPPERSSPPDRARVSWVDRLEYAVRSRGAKVVVLALVANTMVAQLLYNSAGQLVLSSGFLLGYLLFSAVCSTVAFALFEVSTIFQLHDLHTLDASIKSEIGADKLIRRGYLVLVVSSLINFLSVLYFLALAWHSTSGASAKFPLDDLPSPWNWLYYTPSMLWPTPSCSSLPAFMASDHARQRRSSWPPSERLSSAHWNCGGCKPRQKSKG
jgi:hypothetical protein